MKKQLLSRINHPYTIIAAYMVLFGIECILLADILPRPWSDLVVNLAASFIAVIPTVIFVNMLIERHREKRWEAAHETGKVDLRHLRNKLVSYMASPLGYVIDYPDNPNPKEDFEKEAELQLKKLLRKIREADMRSELTGLDENGWKNFASNLRLVKPDFLEYMQLYQEVMPPEVMGALLRVHKELRSIFFTFMVLADLFTKPQTQWPKFKTAEAASATRSSILISLSEGLTSYFKAVDEFSIELDRWSELK